MYAGALLGGGGILPVEATTLLESRRGELGVGGGGGGVGGGRDCDYTNFRVRR